MTELLKAQLVGKTDAKGKDLPPQRRPVIQVSFNPEKLDLSITNAIQDNPQRNKRQPPQFVTSSTAKLSLELVFDTTMDGSDVRLLTNRVARLMKPAPSPDKNNPQRGIPSIVIFEWGAFTFEGYIDSYRENLDFWAAQGVPLRATLTLSITEQEAFLKQRDQPFRNPERAPKKLLVNDRVLPVQPGESLDALARRLGDAAAAAALALRNLLENRRRPDVDEIVIPEGGPLGQPPPGFADAGADAGVEADSGAGANASPGASFAASAGANGGAPFGSAAGAFSSAGASASAGGTLAPFAGLRASPSLSPPRPRLSLDAGLEVGGSASLSLSGSAGFGIGGKAGMSAGAGLCADVGAEPGAIRIIFEET